MICFYSSLIFYEFYYFTIPFHRVRDMPLRVELLASRWVSDAQNTLM